MASQLDHLVHNYTGHSPIGPKNIEVNKNYWDIYSSGKPRAGGQMQPTDVLQAMAKQSGSKKVLLFNLSPHFNFDDFKSYLQNWRPQVGGRFKGNYTNDELAIILSNKEVFDRVRWFRNGRELTFDELRDTFGQMAPDLFRSP